MAVRNFFAFICTVYLVVWDCNSEPKEVRIGGLFDEDWFELHLAFEQAVQYVNEERILRSHKLVADGRTVVPNNDFVVSNAVCDLFRTGVVGVFGPTKGTAADFVQSMCDNKEIPHVEFRSNVNQFRGALMINLYPYPPAMARVYVDLIRAWNWQSFTIFYESFHGLPQINELLKMYDRNGYSINVRQLDDNRSGNFRPALRAAKLDGETHFVIECSLEKLYKVLSHAQQVGLMSSAHNYIIMNPDFHTLDLTAFQYGGSNITGVRLVDPKNEFVVAAATDLYERKRIIDPDVEVDRTPEEKFKSNTALLFDAVRVFAMALQDLHRPYLTAKSLACSAQDNWEHGNSLINFLKTKTVRGLTGEIKFDHEGFRSDFTLDIVELSEKGLIKVGVWNSTEGLNISRPLKQDSEVDETNLLNRTFTVLISLTEPYAMLKHTSKKLTGNDRFEGFGIDLIYELSKLLGFNVNFKLHPNSVYGGFNKKTKQWTGMIRELMEHRGDLAITDFTITAERESGVDFTMPFMNLGISILYKKPMKMPPKLLSFASPFSIDVWIGVGVAFFFSSVMMFVIGRISPAEWNNPDPCVEDPEFLYNQFSFGNSFWFSLGAIMTQGSEIAPIAISTRMVAGCWCFFALILVSSYTANLAAFLTVESLYTPIKNIEDLANQDVIKYGAKKDGATASFFAESNYTVYKKIWEHMEANRDTMPTENPLGVIRADQENYAFLMESTGIEYTIERYCNLTQVGGLLDNKGYGIAMRKNSPYRSVLSTAVLKLQETGRLAELKNKWWKEKRGGGKCMDDNTSEGAAELNFQNVGGVFLVLVVGCALGVIVAIAELLIEICRRSHKKHTTFATEFAEECKFLIKCSGQEKPNTCRKSQSLSPRHSDHSLKTLNDNFPSTYGFINPEVKKNPSGSSGRQSKLT